MEDNQSSGTSKVSKEDRRLVEKRAKAEHKKYKALQEVKTYKDMVDYHKDKETDPSKNHLVHGMYILMNAKREARKFHKKFIKYTKELDIGLEVKEENTLLSNDNQRAKIVEMYFKQGKSAVEIYEQLVKEGEIPENSYLLTGDVIDVIGDEAKRLGISSEIIADMVENQEKIEDFRENEKAYQQLSTNANNAGQMHFATISKRKALEARRDQNLFKKNDELFRGLVLIKKAQKKSETPGLTLESINVGSPKTEQSFNKAHFGNFIRGDNHASEVTQKDVSEQVGIIKALKDKLMTVVRPGTKTNVVTDPSSIETPKDGPEDEKEDI